MIVEEIKKNVFEKVAELLCLANELYKIDLPNVEIGYFNNSTDAGRAYGYRKVTFNETLLIENYDAFMNDTVPHELAHIVVSYIYRGYRKQPRPHGNEWKRVVVQLGGIAQRTHSFSTKNIKTRKQNRYTYKCPCCGKEYDLSATRHNRIMAGQRYFDSCRAPLVFVKSL